LEIVIFLAIVLKLTHRGKPVDLHHTAIEQKAGLRCIHRVEETLVVVIFQHLARPILPTSLVDKQLPVVNEQAVLQKHLVVCGHLALIGAEPVTRLVHILRITSSVHPYHSFIEEI
jgi:hypothetical protein